MVRERIGRVLVHECGHIWPTRLEKQARCPGCFGKITKNNTFKITKKHALEIFEQLQASKGKVV